MADDKTALMKGFAVCELCQDYYKDPRTLPCSHIYCAGCIKKGIRNKRFICPSDGSDVVNETNIDKLPISRVAEAVAHFLAIRFQDTSKIKCDNCSSNACKYWCDKCESYLCVTCSSTIHSAKINQNHPIVGPEQKPMSNQCLEHSDEKLKYWCTTCENLVCRDCLLFKHKDHACVGLQQVAEETKARIQSFLEPIKQNLDKASMNTRHVIQEQEKYHAMMQEDINRTFLELHSFLNTRQEQLMAQLNKHRRDEILVLEQYRKNVDKQLETIKARELLLKEVGATNSSIQMMQMSRTFIALDQQIVGQHERICQGCTFLVGDFEKNSIVEKNIAEYGAITTYKMLASTNDLRARHNCISVNLSRATGKSEQYPYEPKQARGYVFQLEKVLKIRAVEIEAAVYGEMIVYILNESGVITKQKSSMHSDIKMMWRRIFISAELKSGYSILIWRSNKNGQFSYIEGDNNVRRIASDVSIESKYAIVNGILSVGDQLKLLQNTFSIQMKIDVEQ